MTGPFFQFYFYGVFGLDKNVYIDFYQACLFALALFVMALSLWPLFGPITSGLFKELYLPGASLRVFTSLIHHLK